jgi:hypothetical protein
LSGNLLAKSAFGMFKWLSTSQLGRILADWRRSLGYFHDIVMAAIAFAAASTLAIGYDNIIVIPGFPEKILLFTIVSAAVFYFFELNSGNWRYASIPDLTAILKSATVAVLTFVLIVFIYSRGEGLSRLALFLVWFFLVTLLAGPRILYRMVREGGVREILTGSGQPNLSAGIVKDEKIPVPTMAEQTKIATIARSLERSLQNLNSQRARLQNQKRGLMQKLLTGEWQLDKRFDSVLPTTENGSAA